MEYNFNIRSYIANTLLREKVSVTTDDTGVSGKFLVHDRAKHIDLIKKIILDSETALISNEELARAFRETFEIELIDKLKIGLTREGFDAKSKKPEKSALEIDLETAISGDLTLDKKAENILGVLESAVNQVASRKHEFPDYFRKYREAITEGDYLSRNAIMMAPNTHGYNARKCSGEVVIFFIEDIYRWESLRRAIEIAGERVVVPDVVSTRTSPIGPGFARDPLLLLNDKDGNQVAVLPDNHGRRFASQPSFSSLLTSELSFSEGKPSPRQIRKKHDFGLVGGNMIPHDLPSSETGAERERVIYLAYKKGESYELANGEDVDPDPVKEKEEFEEARDYIYMLTGKRVIPVDVYVDRRFYDLDTFMAALPNGEVILYPEATSAESFSAIKNAVGEKNIIQLNENQAKELSANLIHVSGTNKLVMTYCDGELEEILTKKGYEVISPKTVGLGKEASWRVRDGGVRCLTSFEILSTAQDRSAGRTGK